jgi:transposase InsO family protein
MAPPPTLEHLNILNNEFYKNYNFFGRDKLFNLLRDKYGEDKSPSRRQISDWLKSQEINQIYTPSKGKPKDIKSSMTTPNKILAMDLVDLQKFQVRGYKYLLNAIDMSSRYIYSVALKSKTDTEVLNGFKKIFNKSKIRAVRSDNGSEFINKKFTDYLEKNDIKQILSEASKPQSNGMIERANATIKELIQKSIEMIDKFDWAKNLDKLIDNINNSKHRITGFTPNEIQTAFKNDNKDVLEKAFNKEMKIKKPNISKEVYEVGDLVRIKKPSDKTRQVWSNEVYEIERVYKPKKSYSVYEYKLNEFKDRFKEEELLKIVGNPQNKLLKVDKFVISKLLRPVIKDNKEHYEVQWKGYRETTFEPRDILLEDVPKMVNQFEKKNKITFYDSKNKKTNKISKKISYGKIEED